VLLDAKTSLPGSGESIQIAAFFQLESIFSSSNHTVVMSETHWDKLWEVQLDPKFLLRNFKAAPQITTEEEGRAFLEKYGYYFVSKEVYGAAITTYFTESSTTTTLHSTTQASGTDRLTALWQCTIHFSLSCSLSP
jgi:hypothetical protein